MMKEKQDYKTKPFWLSAVKEDKSDPNWKVKKWIRQNPNLSKVFIDDKSIEEQARKDRIKKCGGIDDEQQFKLVFLKYLKEQGEQKL